MTNKELEIKIKGIKEMQRIKDEAQRNQETSRWNQGRNDKTSS